MPEETKPDPKAEAKKAAAELKAKRDELKKSVGQSFSNGTRTAKVTSFEPDKSLATKVADAYLVNFGNPFRSDYIFCDEFLANFNVKK